MFSFYIGQISFCRIPSNFLVQHRAEFPIEFTLSVWPHDLNISFCHTYDEHLMYIFKCSSDAFSECDLAVSFSVR